MTSTKIHIMGFIPPTQYDDIIHKIILTHRIKEDTDLIVEYKNIDYIVGNVWDSKTRNFEPGPGANIIINGKITQNDINTINNAYRKDENSHLILSLGYKYKYDYNNNNWYSNDIEHALAFNRFTIPKSLINKNNVHGKQLNNTNTLMKSYQFANDNKQLIDTNATSTKTPVQQTHSQMSSRKYIPPPLRSKLLSTKHTSTHSQIPYRRYIPPPLRTKLLSNKKPLIHPTDDKIFNKIFENKNKYNTISPLQTITNDSNNTNNEATHNTLPSGTKLFQKFDDSGALSTSKALPDDTANSKNITYKHNKLSLEVNDESLAQNRTYKEINSSLEKHKTSHSNDVSDSTCTKTHSGITTTSSTQNENPNTSIAKAETIPNDNNNIDNIDANNNTPKPIPNGSNNINDIDENNNTKFTLQHIIPTSPNANIANMRAISGKKWNNQYTKEKLIETSGKTLKLTATLDKKLIETLNSDAISPPKTISNGNILYTLDTG